MNELNEKIELKNSKMFRTKLNSPIKELSRCDSIVEVIKNKRDSVEPSPKRLKK